MVTEMVMDFDGSLEQNLRATVPYLLLDGGSKGNLRLSVIDGSCRRNSYDGRCKQNLYDGSCKWNSTARVMASRASATTDTEDIHVNPSKLSFAAIGLSIKHLTAKIFLSMREPKNETEWKVKVKQGLEAMPVFSVFSNIGT